METETMSRILLTVLILVPLGFSLVWISNQHYIFGGTVLIGSILVLWWIWNPKNRARDKMH